MLHALSAGVLALPTSASHTAHARLDLAPGSGPRCLTYCRLLCLATSGRRWSRWLGHRLRQRTYVQGSHSRAWRHRLVLARLLRLVRRARTRLRKLYRPSQLLPGAALRPRCCLPSKARHLQDPLVGSSRLPLLRRLTLSCLPVQARHPARSCLLADCLLLRQFRSLPGLPLSLAPPRVPCSLRRRPSLLGSLLCRHPSRRCCSVLSPLRRRPHRRRLQLMSR